MCEMIHKMALKVSCCSYAITRGHVELTDTEHVEHIIITISAVYVHQDFNLKTILLGVYM